MLRRLTITGKSASKRAMLAVGLLGAGVAGVVYAQIEGPERGVLPIASTGDFEVAGIVVNVKGDDSWDARKKGWQEAQRKAWSRLWASTHGGKGASLPDSALDGLVSAIIVEEEQIGPRRYVARLGVVFDRARAGQILGLSGTVVRSAPLLVVPVMYDSGSAMVFEQRTDWQKAWARARLGESAIDYVRPSGAGNDSLVLTAGQADRRNREWWRVVLDQFGAADILLPMVRLERSWPGGPVKAHFIARYGPDNRYLGRFTLKVNSPAGLPAMLDQGVQRLDKIYAQALLAGTLRPDTSLIIEEEVEPEVIEELTDDIAVEPVADESGGDSDAGESGVPAVSTQPAAPVQSFAIQFVTPDASAVGASEAAIRAVPGVQSASTTSLALGGTSVMQVRYAGDSAALRAALFARGWQVSGSGSTLRIQR